MEIPCEPRNNRPLYIGLNALITRLVICLILFGFCPAVTTAFPIDAAGTHVLSYLESHVSSESVGGQTVSRTYDSLGRVAGVSLTGVKVPGGGELVNMKVGYTYGADGTITGVTTFSNGPGTWSSYDGVTGRPLGFQLDRVSETTTIDQLGRVTGQTNTGLPPGPGTMFLSAAGAKPTAFASLVRLPQSHASVPKADKAPRTFDYEFKYDADGHCIAQQAPEGAIAYTYGSKGYLSSAVGAGQNYAYAFDAAGRLVSTAPDYYPLTGSGVSKVYVTGSVAPGAAVSINAVPTDVDPRGKFSETFPVVPDTTQNYTVVGTLGTAKSQVKTNISLLPVTSQSFTYDGDGNRTGDALWTYTWNALDQLVSMQQTAAALPAGTLPLQVDFINDVQGRRVEKRVSHVVPNAGGTGTKLEVMRRTATVYDGWRPVLDTDYDASGNVLAVRAYTWGPDISGTLEGAGGIGGLVEIAELRLHGAGTLSVPVTDGQGTIVGLIDEATGQVVAHYTYGPFGEYLGQTGSRANSCPFRYSTRRYDPETGFYCFGKRYYDPVSKVWLSRDPAREGGGTNLYAYCNDDPVGNVDPFGLDPSESWSDFFFGKPIKDNFNLQQELRGIDPSNSQQQFDSEFDLQTRLADAKYHASRTLPGFWAYLPEPGGGDPFGQLSPETPTGTGNEHDLSLFAWSAEGFVVNTMTTSEARRIFAKAYASNFTSDERFWADTGTGIGGLSLLAFAPESEIGEVGTFNKINLIGKDLAGTDSWVLGIDGRLGGKLVSKDRLSQVKRFLGQFNIQLRENQDDFLAAKGAGAQFGYDPLRGGVLSLRSNPTIYELEHELQHARDFVNLGNDKFAALGEVQLEENAYRHVMGLTGVDALTTEQREHAYFYLIRIRLRNGVLAPLPADLPLP